MVKLFYERVCQPTLKRLEDPAAAQEECLKNILKRCKDTVFGKQYSFADITSIENFQRKVPITNYESMQPYISRCIQGEQNVLFPDKIVYFLLTAGTTGAPKYYPLGERRLEEVVIELMKRSVFYIVQTGDYTILNGVILNLSTSPPVSEKIGDYNAGLFSGAFANAPLPPQLQMLRTLQSGGGLRRVPPPEIDAIRDWDKKYYFTARSAVSADVRSATGPTSNVVSLLRKVHSQYYDRFLADPELNTETKTKLSRVTQNGVVNLQELWPDFRVVFVGSMSITPYRRLYHELLGDVVLWESYATTEATVGSQIFPDKGLIPVVDRTFFEFIPDEDEEASPIPLSDIKRGTSYRILVTNNAGFYRYELGDLVTFTELDPPVFGEISRIKTLVNVAGERITEEMIMKVLEQTCQQQGISFIEFAVLPETTVDVIRYHLFVEFTQLPVNLEEYASIVHSQLQNTSLYYKIQCQNGVISPPLIIPVQPGGFEVFLQKLGKDPLQGKVPHLLTTDMSQLIPRIIK